MNPEYDYFFRGDFDKKLVEYVKYKYSQEREVKITIKAWTRNVSGHIDGVLENVKLAIDCEVKSKFGIYNIRLLKTLNKDKDFLDVDVVKRFNGGDAELFRIFATAIVRDIDDKDSDFVRFLSALFKAIFPISSQPKVKRCETCGQSLPDDCDEYEYAEE